MVVGSKADIDEVVKILGDSKNKLQQVNPLPLFLGVALGIILGYIAIPIPGVPSALKLGIAGGPLVMAIFLSRFGSTWTRGKMYWFMPRSANAAIKEIGIVLFLAAVGLNAGRNFVASVTSSDGLYWLMWGAMITFIPVMTMALIGRLFLKVNYLSLCGTLAGACTDPPALAYSNSMHTNAEASSLAYATVYPFSMFLRILSPQLFVILIMMVS
jgi:putative transport protein